MVRVNEYSEFINNKSALDQIFEEPLKVEDTCDMRWWKSLYHE